MTSTRPPYDALLLDIGDVITAPVWDQFDELEQVIGRTIAGRGPPIPNDDPWLRTRGARSRFAEYWQQYAQRNGFDDWRDLFRQLGTYLPHRFGDPDAYELMADAAHGRLQGRRADQRRCRHRRRRLLRRDPRVPGARRVRRRPCQRLRQARPRAVPTGRRRARRATGASHVPRRRRRLHRRRRAGRHDRRAGQPDRQAPGVRADSFVARASHRQWADEHGRTVPGCRGASGAGVPRHQGLDREGVRADRRGRTRRARLAAFGETWLPGYPRWVNAPIHVRPQAQARRPLRRRRDHRPRTGDRAAVRGGP